MALYLMPYYKAGRPQFAEPFRRMLKAQRRYADRHVILRGCVQRTIGVWGMSGNGACVCQGAGRLPE